MWSCTQTSWLSTQLRLCPRRVCIPRNVASKNRWNQTISAVSSSDIVSSTDTIVGTEKVAPDVGNGVSSHASQNGKLMTWEDCHNLSDIWKYLGQTQGDEMAVSDPHHGRSTTHLTFRELEQQIESCALGLKQLGLQQGDVVSLFSENSYRWLISDAAIMRNGAIDAVRGVGSSTEELGYILEHSGSCGLFVQDENTLKKVKPYIQLAKLKFIIVLWESSKASDVIQTILDGAKPNEDLPQIIYFWQLSEQGRQFQQQQSMEKQWPAVSEVDPATIVYTSGTSGHPKGVLLSHGNILYQMHNFDYFMPIPPRSVALSLLPPWHIYERTTTYYILSRLCHVIYTSVPNLKTDLQKYKPSFMCVVPLVLDTLYRRVMLQMRNMYPSLLVDTIFGLGEKVVKSRWILDGMDVRYADEPPPTSTMFVATLTVFLLGWLYEVLDKVVYSKIRSSIGIQSLVVAGGSSLPEHLDLFYQVIGLPILHGWGLTETSPVLSCRRQCDGGRPLCTIGSITPGTEIRIVNEESSEEVADGEIGVMLAKGPGIMMRYYNQEDSGVSSDGWFNTGDLGKRIPHKEHHQMGGTIMITGRAKDVIVLSSGENVSPQPIEDTLTSSPYIKSCVLLGQDHRQLGALVCMDEEVVSQEFPDGCDLIQIAKQEIQRLVNKNPKFARWEHIAEFVILPTQLSFEEGTLTRTMKPKREAIRKKFESEVNQVLSALR